MLIFASYILLYNIICPLRSTKNKNNIKKCRDLFDLCTFVCYTYAVSIEAASWSLSSSTAWSRILYLRILPAAFMGKLSTKVT